MSRSERGLVPVGARRRRGRWVRCVAGVSIAVAVVATGCSGGDESTDKESMTTTTFSAPDECAGVEIPEGDDGPGPLPAELPPKCRNAIFNQVVEASGSKELKAVDPDQRLGFAQGVCAFSRSIPENPESVPTYAGFLRSTASSWKVPEPVVDEVVGLAGNICPTDLAPLFGLRSETGAPVVDVEVAGVGKVRITYTGPNGDEMSADVTSPWVHQVRLPEGTAFRLTAEAEGGKAQCRLTVNGNEVAKAEPSDEPVECEASSEAIRTAGL